MGLLPLAGLRFLACSWEQGSRRQRHALSLYDAMSHRRAVARLHEDGFAIQLLVTAVLRAFGSCGLFRGAEWEASICIWQLVFGLVFRHDTRVVSRHGAGKGLTGGGSTSHRIDLTHRHVVDTLGPTTPRN